MPKLTSRPATVTELEAALDDRTGLADALGAPVPEGWPEKVAMFRSAAEQIRANPEGAAWLVYFFFDEAGVLVGSGGYLGPPTGSSPDRIVEIGYEIAVPSRQRGLGTAAVSALIEHAQDSGAVDTVIARTAPDGKNPSVKILKSLGFTNFGLVPPPDSDGDHVWQWQRDFASSGG